MRQLSKSKLMAYRQCPKRLWLEIHKPELRDDSGSQAVFAAGNLVGEAARQALDPKGNGVNVDPNDIGWEASARRTNAELEKGDRAIFEAYIRIPGALALVDVMRPDTDFSDLRWELIEVKGAASLKDYHKDEVAIQTYIAEKNGIPLSKSCLAYINSNFVYPGENDYNGLFVIEDLTKEARSRTKEVETWLQDAQEIASLKSAPEIPVGDQCVKPYPCGFCNFCSDGLEESKDPFFMIPHFSKKKRAELVLRGVDNVEGIPDDWLSERQSFVRTAHLTGEVYLDAENAQNMLGPQREYTYFLDFETISFAVPIWAQSRPYQNIPFQYSLHRLDQDGSLHHTEFLDLSYADPRLALAEKMIEECGSKGTIYAYNAGFERNVIKSLAMTFPHLGGSLENLLMRIDDLLPIVRSCYYNPVQNGSWSLKAVAPAIDPELNYDNLTGVQDGSEAGAAYLEACKPETTFERKKELHCQMLEYCKSDTLATVRIWQHLQGLTPKDTHSSP